MNVGELIKALEAFDPELPILIPSSRVLEFCEPTEVFADVAAPASHDDLLELCDYVDEDATTFVRLGLRSDVEERDERPRPAVN
jgi:uncharacterized protein YozE (UPF0346 family)